MKDRDFLEWLYVRLMQEHNERNDTDYMIKFKEIIRGMDPDQVTNLGTICSGIDNKEQELYEECKAKMEDWEAPPEDMVLPLQPTRIDKHETLRFTRNRMVELCLEMGPVDMNMLAILPFTQTERQQFAQITGYSVSGYGDLSYCDDESYRAAYENHKGKMTDAEARNVHLRKILIKLREQLAEPIAMLYEIHPEDLTDRD